MINRGSNAAEALDFSAVDASPEHPGRWRVLLLGGIVLAVIALAAVFVPKLTIDAKRSQLMEQVSERLQITAAGQAEVISTWLQGTRRLAEPVVESELIRLFAAEMDLAGGDMSRMVATPNDDSGLGVPLVEQLPFIERVISDFSTNADFLAAYLVGRSGDAFVTSSGSASFTGNQHALAMQSFERGQSVFGPARTLPAGLVMDLAMPVFAAQVEPSDARPVAVLVLVAPLASGLSEILAVDPLASPGARRALIQLDNNALFQIAPGSADAVKGVSLEGFDLAEGEVPFGRRSSLSGPGQVYSAGAMVSGPTWWVVEELDVAAAEGPLATYSTAAIVVASLVVIAVAIAFGAFWWRLSSLHNETLARQYQNLANRIHAQKQLLDSINGTIPEHIGLKAADGTYRYVNPAFAAAVGRDPENIVGLDDAAIFGRGTAKRLALTERRVVKNQEAITTDEEVYFDSSLRHLQISKVPFVDSDGASQGIVSVTRDVTELVEQQRKKERAIEQMVSALVRAIELRDPYLAGHSRRVAEFAVSVGKELDCDADELTTLELAANLSQIGKLAIPQELLTKPARLSEDEIRQMETHVEHAVQLLGGIDFELPVVETISQMHERLDGKGYPKGLGGDAITLAARILGTCDVFCARVEPRSYRSGLAPAAVLDILQENSNRYDPKVIEALRQVAATIPGERLIASIATG
ncbi:PAS domain-containing protein [Pelagibius litoralis]|uniref:PAS domain-containing protein n=1 Tax=Pelagibius litoralis TaxID=374515 RepID=A0A967F2W9_9PROT|nr:HD domain-containing phosphohydrolase [Pelagibius litoralis]NIA72023.1 PAS domain-containing protein [Pelagibius litoralis]